VDTSDRAPQITEVHLDRLADVVTGDEGALDDTCAGPVQPRLGRQLRHRLDEDSLPTSEALQVIRVRLGVSVEGPRFNEEPACMTEQLVELAIYAVQSGSREPVRAPALEGQSNRPPGPKPKRHDRVAQAKPSQAARELTRHRELDPEPGRQVLAHRPANVLVALPTSVPAPSNPVSEQRKRPRIMILRGQLANPWELRPWERLCDRFDIVLVVPRLRLHPLGSLDLPQLQVRAVSDLVPTARGSGFVARLPFNRHLGLEPVLAGASVVHVVDLHPWFSAQAAALKGRLGYRLVTTIWETLPLRGALRHPLTRSNRERVLRATDVFLAATQRARLALELEGVASGRIRLAPPGIDVRRFARERPAHLTGDDPLVISPGRLVWEKGHQDVLRAIAALRAGVVSGPPAASRVRLLIVGSGPEERRLRAYAEDLGLSDVVRFQRAVPYDDMPEMYAQAAAMVLASLPAHSWEEQFGMVLVEAMAAQLPIVTTACGAIPEVVAPEVSIVAPGDWAGIARALADGPRQEPGRPVHYTSDALERFGVEAAASRLANAYEAVLAEASLAAA
jgi:glycosyltransferase involved in cell wall biosynthesis